MNEQPTFDLDAALAALAASIDVDDAFTARVMRAVNDDTTDGATTDDSAAVLALPPRRAPRPRLPWRVAVAAAVAAAVVTFSVPEARAAVADWFRVGGMRIERVDRAVTTTTTAASPISTAVTLDNATLLRMLGLRAANNANELRTHLGVAPRQPHLDTIAAPDLIAVEADGRPPQVAMVWRTTATLAPSAAVPEASIVFTQFRGTSGDGLFQKLLPAGSTVERVSFAGTTAFWLGGSVHELYVLDATGNLAADTMRLAGNTLVWTDGTITYRLETSLPRDQALAFAASVR